MKLIYGLIILLTTIVVSASTLVDNTQRPIKWVPIYGFKHPTSSAFLDANSVIRKESENGGHFGSAGILMVSKKSFPMLFLGKTIRVKSVVKHMVMDCKTGMLAPAIDFYFGVDKPTRDDKALGALVYPDMVGVEVVSKNSLIYTVLCPVYI